MNLIAWHFASGNAFCTGVGAVVIGGALLATTDRRWLKRVAALLALTGGIFVCLSATPLPLWSYGLGLLALPAWLWSERAVRAPRWTRWSLRTAVLAGLLALLAAELPHRRLPVLPGAAFRHLIVIGDSLSARLTGTDTAWPELLARQTGLDVANLAVPGETLRTALAAANRLDSRPAVVVLEIGGNDLLDDTPVWLLNTCTKLESGDDVPRNDAGPKQFAADLRDLLVTVHHPARQLIMLELPLPPLANRYGQIQRRLAREFGVTLIPKRYFAAIFATPGATVDGLHLSAAGHEQMARMIGSVVAPLCNTNGVTSVPRVVHQHDFNLAPAARL